MKTESYIQERIDTFFINEIVGSEVANNVPALLYLKFILKTT